MKRGCVIPMLVLFVLALCVGAALGVMWLATPVTRPIVLINTPRDAARVPVNHDTVIQAIARDEQKIKRVELWVNDQLLDAQNSTLPGGSSPFPLALNWRPTISGTYTISVRAFNTRGARSHTTITLQAQQAADRDADQIADAEDACPDQPGTRAAQGCPDRDGDGIRDSADACADQAGLIAARGCPAPSARDRDGDGTLDAADACPDQPGAPFAQGCPDTDGDGVGDANDACPREAGLGQNGCPTPGDADGDGVADANDACPRVPGRAEFAGCADDDGDGVPTPNDACPRERGSAQLAGCPDRDSDGVRDALDLCPAAPGPAANSGCPFTGARDGDGDGVLDDIDLAPGEPGLASNGGSPIPGRGADRDGNQIPDDVEPPRREGMLPGGLVIPLLDLDLSRFSLIPRRPVPKIMTAVELDALSYRVFASGDLTDLTCYITLRYTITDGAGVAVPVETVVNTPGGLDLDPGAAEREWNLPQVLGAESERVFAADTDYPVNIQVSCLGIVERHADVPLTYELGSFSALHASSDWDGHVMWANSAGGEGGRRFHVEYRLCQNACETSTYQAPVLELFDSGPRESLHWTYAGDVRAIRGFGIYVNGSIRDRMPPTINAYDITTFARPPCGETYRYHVTVYGGEAGAVRESPPSNTVTLTSAHCPRRVRVTFGTVQTGNLGGDESGYSTVGPITGDFFASANARQTISFNASVCDDLSYCSYSEIRHGLRLGHNATYTVQSIFDWVHTQQASCLGGGCASNHYRASEVNFVTVMLGGDDDLTFGGTIMDVDWGGDAWGTLFDASEQIRARELVPGVPVERTLRNRNITLTVQIEMLSE